MLAQATIGFYWSNTLNYLSFSTAILSGCAFSFARDSCYIKTQLAVTFFGIHQTFK